MHAKLQKKNATNYFSKRLKTHVFDIELHLPQILNRAGWYVQILMMKRK